MIKSTRKNHEALRSARWFAPDDLRSFGHRSRLMQLGYAPGEFMGRPVIGILNTWSELNSCHSHFRERAKDVKRGALLAGIVAAQHRPRRQVDHRHARRERAHHQARRGLVAAAH